MSDSGMSAYLGVFMDELDEQLQILNEQILELERDGTNTATIGHIFRAAHTLKGSSAAMGFEPMKQLTHAIENVFEKIRNRGLFVNSELITVLFQAIDYLKVLKVAIINDQLDQVNISPLVLMLDQVQGDSAHSDASGEPKAYISTDEDTDFIWSNDDMDAASPLLQDGHRAVSLYIRLEHGTEMMEARKLIIANSMAEFGHVLRIEPPFDDNTELSDSGFHLLLATKADDAAISDALGQLSHIEAFRIGPAAFDSSAISEDTEQAPLSSEDASASRQESKIKVNQTVRVDVDRLEKLLNYVGELIIDNTRLTEVTSRLNQQFRDHSDVVILNEIGNHLSRVVSELQEDMMKTRMLPIDQLFNRFPRMMRDVALQTGKEIDFSIEGKETELDRTLIEELSDPLIHILRNAADHGIESPEERIKLGKPRKGKLLLKASHQENQIVITIADDGKGIDPHKIKEAAIRKGFITAEEANRLSDKELVFLIFHSGMSTAERVTDISGRGVGMDIVRAHIEKLNGVIDIDTSPGEGTVFTIKLPLTLAIIRSLLVKLGQSTFAIPLVNVLEIVRLQASDIQTIQGREVCVIRGSVFPLVRLHRRLQLEGADAQGTDKRLFVVVLGIADKRVCFVVDKTLGNQEIVIKSLGKFIGDVPYVSGSTILGDGKVALILDVGSVVKEEGSQVLSKDQDVLNKDQQRAREVQLVTFRLDEEQYALEISKVKEIITVPSISKVVRAPEGMLGMINLRGAVLPVFDLRQMFGLPYKPPVARSRVMVIEAGNRDVGILIDEVTEVLKVQQNEIEAAPDQHASMQDRQLIQGIYKQQDKFVIVLHIEHALRTEHTAIGF